jgi:hypothetical protein
MVTATAVQAPARREAPGGVTARRELMARIEARKPQGSYRTAPGAGAFGQDLRVFIPPPDPGPRAPKDVGEFIDDRVAGVLGSRTVLKPAEFAWLAIAEACRAGPAAARKAVRQAARGLDPADAYRVWLALEEMLSKAGGVDASAVRAAYTEARALDWHKPPRRRRRED